MVMEGVRPGEEKADGSLSSLLYADTAGRRRRKEPSTLLMFGSGLLAIGEIVRRGLPL